MRPVEITKPARARRASGTVCLCLVAACGGTADNGFGPASPDDLPTMPMPMPGQAMLAGRVVDMTGQAVVGANLRVAELDLMVASVAGGNYQLMVPSDSTLTLQVTADGFAKTDVESIQLPSGKTVTGFDVLIMTAAKIGEYNTMVAAPAADRGVMVVTVRSGTGKCTPDGAVVDLAPASVGKVLYARTGGSAGEPDSSLTTIQSATGVSAWIAGLFPPGSHYKITAQKTGCAAMLPPIASGDTVHLEKARVEAGNLTQLTVFIE